ncbi:MAG: glycosyltransferase family 4 protein, partial [Dehalococcoidia bacterium]
KQIPGITLMIAGDGYLAKEIANYRFIKHLKYVPNERMNEIYNMADVYVLPSLYENCPSTILEAMACCLPIISTPVGDVINILPEGNPIIPSRDVPKLKEAIEEVIRMNKLNRELLEHIKNLNLQRARESFSTSGIAQKLLQLYENKIVKDA